MEEGKKDSMRILLEVLLILVLLELVRRWIVKILALEEKNQRLQEKLDAMEQLYGEMREEIEVTKKYRHDMKKHIHVLEGLLEKYGEVNAQGEYVGSENIKAITQHTMYSDNIFIDTICTLKNKQCREKGITLQITMDFQEFVPMREIDINGLLQNLLDNAIEATEQVREEMYRKIDFSVYQEDAGWRMTVQNYCEEPEKVNFQTTKPDKRNHGYGMKIIRDIVKTYGGTVEYQKKENEKQVIVQIFFPKKESLSGGI